MTKPPPSHRGETAVPKGEKPMTTFDDEHCGEWGLKNATLSDKTASNEFGLSREEIVAAIKAGKLQYRVGYMHGNPWFRLLRREVEAMVKKAHGGGFLEDQKTKTELAQVNRELKRLKKKMTALERRRAELTATLSKGR
ncbi:MAG: hypothetical protein HY901_18920 [Deltaproteobacteria bacterium]|nr:hypothetical protein [Deltaproteobacteria bacterium]